jgi:phosphoribosylaminoimidazolecarboxamide formyltransferase/IMP cyclohydrolase
VAARRDVGEADVIENIDIGGPTMIRAAAKNHAFAAVVTSPESYDAILDELREADRTLSLPTRRWLAADAFAYTARYDTAIARWFAEGAEGFPATFLRAYEKVTDLSYGENPHQRAAYYQQVGARRHVLSQVQQHHGKEISYNNILDLDTARALVAEFEEPACAIVKHNTPCGAAIGADGADAYRRAFAADPVSAFGGIVALNRPVDEAAAQALSDQFVEVLFAPGYEGGALEILARKPNVRILENMERRGPAGDFRVTQVEGGPPRPGPDATLVPGEAMEVVTGRAPTDEEWAGLRFAWRVCRHVKSNAIVLAAQGATAGIGAGQMSRVDAVRLAVEKSQPGSLQGAVLASDAFFPFPDGPALAIEAGVTAIVQPGGSSATTRSSRRPTRPAWRMVFTGRGTSATEPHGDRAPRLGDAVGARGRLQPRRPRRRPRLRRGDDRDDGGRCDRGAGRRLRADASGAGQRRGGARARGRQARGRRAHAPVRHRHHRVGGRRSRPRRGVRGHPAGHGDGAGGGAAGPAHARGGRGRGLGAARRPLESLSVRRLAHHAALVLVAGPASTPSLRGWQERALVAMRAWRGGPFLLSAAPGAGKTRPALVLARELLRAGAVRRLAVVCPTTPLTRQWARAAGLLGVHLVPDAAELRAPRDFDGVAVTYARVASAAARWERQRSGATLVIADEAHHLGEELAWGEGFARAFASAGALAAAVRHAVSQRRHADPRRALRRRRRRRARRQLHVRGGGPRRRLPAGDLRRLRRRAAVAQRRRHRGGVVRRRPDRPRRRPPLPHRDLHRAARRPPAHPGGGARAPAGPAGRGPSRRGRARRGRRRRARARDRRPAAGRHRRGAAGRLAHGGAGG